MNRRELPERRERLDRQIRNWKPGKHQPVHGWIREVREALGMSAKQLAKRLKRSQPAISLLERAETKGTIRLGTLRKAAEAMGCQLYYLIAPPRGKKLGDVAKDRAMRIATFPTMLKLRKAGILNEVKGALLHEFIATYAEDIKPRDLWTDADPEPIVKLILSDPPPPPPKDPAVSAEEARIDALANLAVEQAKQSIARKKKEAEEKAKREREKAPEAPPSPPTQAPQTAAGNAPPDAERAAAIEEAKRLLEELKERDGKSAS
jgi:predicted DNA-binding mobile mystery protein A